MGKATTYYPSGVQHRKAEIAIVETDGEIPPYLAAETMRILELHRLNGDLGWVKDMIHDLEAQQKNTPLLGMPAPI